MAIEKREIDYSLADSYFTKIVAPNTGNVNSFGMCNALFSVVQETAHWQSLPLPKPLPGEFPAPLKAALWKKLHYP